jgi:hypothetical protein
MNRTLLVLTLCMALFVGAIVGGFIAKSMHKAEARIEHVSMAQPPTTTTTKPNRLMFVTTYEVTAPSLKAASDTIRRDGFTPGMAVRIGRHAWAFAAVCIDGETTDDVGVSFGDGYSFDSVPRCQR